jgi:Domain of unknown function (DUF4160)
MPTISIFFGIVIKMFFDDHNPPYFHAEHQGEMASSILEGISCVVILPQERLFD